MDFEIEDDDDPYDFQSKWDNKGGGGFGFGFSAGGDNEEDAYNFDFGEMKNEVSHYSGKQVESSPLKKSSAKQSLGESDSREKGKKEGSKATSGGSAMDKAAAMLDKYSGKKSSSQKPSMADVYRKSSLEFNEDDISIGSEDDSNDSFGNSLKKKGIKKGSSFEMPDSPLYGGLDTDIPNMKKKSQQKGGSNINESYMKETKGFDLENDDDDDDNILADNGILEASLEESADDINKFGTGPSIYADKEEESTDDYSKDDFEHDMDIKAGRSASKSYEEEVLETFGESVNSIDEDEIDDKHSEVAEEEETANKGTIGNVKAFNLAGLTEDHDESLEESNTYAASFEDFEEDNKKNISDVSDDEVGASAGLSRSTTTTNLQSKQTLEEPPIHQRVINNDQGQPSQIHEKASDSNASEERIVNESQHVVHSRNLEPNIDLNMANANDPQKIVAETLLRQHNDRAQRIAAKPASTSSSQPSQQLPDQSAHMNQPNQRVEVSAPSIAQPPEEPRLQGGGKDVNGVPTAAQPQLSKQTESNILPHPDLYQPQPPTHSQPPHYPSQQPPPPQPQPQPQPQYYPPYAPPSQPQGYSTGQHSPYPPSHSPYPQQSPYSQYPYQYPYQPPYPMPFPPMAYPTPFGPCQPPGGSYGYYPPPGAMNPYTSFNAQASSQSFPSSFHEYMMPNKEKEKERDNALLEMAKELRQAKDEASYATQRLANVIMEMQKQKDSPSTSPRRRHSRKSSRAHVALSPKASPTAKFRSFSKSSKENWVKGGGNSLQHNSIKAHKGSYSDVGGDDDDDEEDYYDEDEFDEESNLHISTGPTATKRSSSDKVKDDDTSSDESEEVHPPRPSVQDSSELGWKSHSKHSGSELANRDVIEAEADRKLAWQEDRAPHGSSRKSFSNRESFESVLSASQSLFQRQLASLRERLDVMNHSDSNRMASSITLPNYSVDQQFPASRNVSSSMSDIKTEFQSQRELSKARLMKALFAADPSLSHDDVVSLIDKYS